MKCTDSSPGRTRRAQSKTVLIKKYSELGELGGSAVNMPSQETRRSLSQSNMAIITFGGHGLMYVNLA